MSLNTIPLDGLRPILSYIDLESLIKLYATFDRKIQTLLSSASAFDYLCIKAAGFRIPRAPYRYFMSALRNVKRLRFEDDVNWSPTSISLLLTLNPREIETGRNFINLSVIEMISDAQRYPKNEVLQRMAQNFSSFGFPNFTVLTPRLESLKLANGAITVNPNCQDPQNALRVPATLTKLAVPQSLPLASVLELPLHLISLDIHASPNDLESIFNQFKSLQHLVLRSGTVGVLSAPSVTVPKTLNSVEIVDLVSFGTLFTDPSWRQSCISSITIRGQYENLNDDFGLHLLPPTLKSLHLEVALPEEAYNKREKIFITSLPPSLTSLTIDPVFLSETLPIKTESEVPFSSVTLQHLPSLEHLELISCVPSSRLYDVELSKLGKMPATLKSLHIVSPHVPALTAAEIEQLPPSLKTLQVASFNVELAQCFATHSKDCYLYIQPSVSPWDIPDMVRARSEHWLPHLDTAKFIAYIETYYRSLRVCLNLSLSTSKDANSRLEPNIGFPTTTNYQIGIFSSQLESIVLPATTFTPYFSAYPPSVSSIVAPLSAGKITRWPFKCLTHLDSPLTRIKFDCWDKLANLTLLKATIVDIDDHQVEPFLKHLLSRKTRAIASISLEVSVTGALLPDDDVNGVKHVTWPLMQEMTTSILNRILASPMPSIGSSPPEIDSLPTDPLFHTDTSSKVDNHIENDAIGRIVSSFKVVQPLDTFPICIPSSATSASILVETPWSLAPEWMRIPSTRPDGLRLPTTTSTQLYAPNRLVRLELALIEVFNKILVFPETLKFLAMTYRVIPFKVGKFFLNVRFPSQIEVLLIWSCDSMNNAMHLLAPLPPTLKHLAIDTAEFLGPSPVLPALKTLHMGQLGDHQALKSLPTGQVECVVCAPSHAVLGVDPALNITFAPNLMFQDIVTLVDKRYAEGSANSTATFNASVEAPTSLHPALDCASESTTQPTQLEETSAAPARKKAVRRPR